MKQICCRLLLLVLWCGMILHPQEVHALDPAKNLSQYNCQSWTRQNGLPVNAIRTITQTKDGYIWMGTQNGLIRFDGSDFSFATLPNRIGWRSKTINVLTRSARGGFWFGIEAGTFGYFDGRDQFEGVSGDWVTPTMSVSGIQESDDGSVWIASHSGAACLIGGKTNQIFVDKQLLDILSEFEDPQHRIWFGTVQQGLYYWQDGKLNALPDADLSGVNISAIAMDREGQLWVGTSSGLRCYDRALQRRQMPQMFTEVKALLADQHGAMWIGTAGDGLIRYLNGQSSWLRKTNGLANDNVTALYEDVEGSLWVGTRNGLTQISEMKFPTLSTAGGLLNDPVHGVCTARDGGIWCSTGNGIYHYDGRTAAYFLNDTNSEKIYAKRVLEARDGDVYVNTGNRELLIVSGGKIVARHANGEWPIAMAEDAQGVIAAFGKQLFRVSRTQFVPFTFKGPAPEFYWVRNLFTCADGSLLVASVNGAFRLRDDQVEHWTTADGLPDQDVAWMSEDSDGTIWIGQVTGLSRIKNGKITVIHNELTDTLPYAIEPDNLGNFWISTIRGIICASRRSLNDFADGKTSKIEEKLYDGLESVKTIDMTEVEAVAAKTADGRIWLPGPQGVIQIDPTHLFTNPLPPPVFIQNVLVNGTAPAQTRPGKGELVFHFAAVSYIAPQKIRYRYKLEGYDTAWIEAGSQRSALYANLKPRKYTFRVQACNADGVWNTTGASCDVELPPHYYETGWFQAVLVLAVATGLFGFYRGWVVHLRRKEQKLRADNEALELKIRERTRELAEQRNLLRTLIDHLPDNVFVKDLQSRMILTNQAHADHLGVENPQAVVGKTDFDFYPPEIAKAIFQSEQQLLKTGGAFDREEVIQVAGTGAQFWSHTSKVPLRDHEGNIIGLAGINRDITEQKQAAETIAQERELLRTLIDLLPDIFYIKDLDGRYLVANNALTKHLGKETSDQILGRTDADFFTAEMAAKYRTEELKVLGGEPLIDDEGSVISRDGRECTHLTTKVPFRDSQGKIIGLVGIGRDITARKQWEARLESLHRQLVEASRQAGMAEVATSVLHNVGNVLNSVNISASLLSDRVKHSAADNLERVSRLLREHQNDLAHFLTQDEKGSQLVRYLETLVKQLAGEKIGTLQEIECLVRNIDHIKEIVTLQQSHTRPVGLQEILDPTTLIEDAIGMQAASFARHQIQFRREFAPVPTISVDRHKVIQILVNLLQNAKRACKEKTGIAGEVIVRVWPAGPDRIKIEVEDNGIGIPAENLTRIFAYGFSTRKNGHGFGLHSGALAAKQMGGSLQARSAGSGQGARFTLELPRQPEPNNADSPRIKSQLP